MSAENDVPSGYAYHVIDPADRPALRCRFLLSNEFKQLDMPPQNVDFSKPESFEALFLAMAEYGPLVMTVGVRPAYDEGALSQWLDFLCRENKLDRGEIEVVQVCELTGVACWAGQLDTEGGAVRSRLQLVSDGGRLFYVAATGPEKLWRAGLNEVERMLKSFELASVTGQQPPATPQATAGADGVFRATPEEEQQAKAECTPEEWATLALAEDASSLDPDEPMNARLRDNGVGLVPNVMYVDKASKSAKVACGAIRAYLTLPLGWHVIDDGKRTLVFDAAGKIQVNFSLRLTEGANREQLGDAYVGQYLEQQPNLQRFAANLQGIVIAGIVDANIDGEVLNQAFLIRETPDPALALVARVTGKAEDFTRAMNLAGDVIYRAELPSDAPAEASTETPGLTDPAPEVEGPAWWKEAVALERKDELDAAEKRITDAVKEIGAYSQVAHLYELRMARLIAKGDRDGAIDAFRRASDWLGQYAGSATSGGEGAALSQERDDRRAALVSQLGFDPEAK